MKLHLPKLLLLAAFSAFSSNAATLTQTQDSDGNTLWNVGKYEVTSMSTDDYKLPSAAGVTEYTENNGVLTLSGNEKLGVFDSNSLVTSSLGAIKFDDDGKLEFQYIVVPKFSYWYNNTSSGTVTNNFKVNTLNITGNASVSLGGQYKVTSDYNVKDLGVNVDLDISSVLGKSYDEYTGLIANNVTVNGEGATLASWNATIGTLQVDKGTVDIHTSGNSKYGNKYFTVWEAEDSKQVSIRKSLIINGGTTKIGNASGSMLQTAFGTLTYSGDTWVAGALVSVDSADVEAAQITQTGGTLLVQGDSVSVDGLHINQSGDKKSIMSISKGAYHDLADYGDSVIAQHNLHADTELNLGVIRAYNSQYNVIKGKLEENGVSVELSPSLAVSHSGAGDINMSGVDFTAEIGSSSQISTIEQYDYVDEENGAVTATTGNINLNGQYLGATFDITQNAEGGAINLNGSMTAGTVSQTAGTLAVGSSATMSAESLSAAGTLTNDGTLQVSGAMVASGKVENNKNLSAQTLEISGGTTTNAVGATLVAGSITVNGGTFINYGAITSADSMMLMTAEAEAIEEANTVNLITIVSGEMKQYGTTTSNILVQNGGTLTLGVVGGQQVTTSVGAVTLEKGASMIVDGTAKTGALTLEGGTITFEVGSTLTASDVSGLENVKITLNLDAETFADIVAGNGYTETVFTVDGGSNALDNTTIYIASEDGEQTQEVYVKQDASGNVTVGQLVVPEPTTATLSLLALAALAARRRRK